MSTLLTIPTGSSGSKIKNYFFFRSKKSSERINRLIDLFEKLFQYIGKSDISFLRKFYSRVLARFNFLATGLGTSCCAEGGKPSRNPASRGGFQIKLTKSFRFKFNWRETERMQSEWER